MKEEIKLISKIDFKNDEVNIYHDALKDANNVDICWQMRNPETTYTGIIFINWKTQKVSYPEDTVIPEQNEYDREIVPKFIITGYDTITEEFINKVIDKLNYGFYKRNIGEQNYLLCDFNDKQFENYNLDNIEECINEFNHKIDVLGVLYGELDPITDFDIYLKNVSHSIKHLTFKDNKIYADIKILDTKMGLKLLNIINTTEYKPIFKLRSVHNNYTINKIFTFDIVT